MTLHSLKPGQSVDGWTVERRLGGGDGALCLARRDGRAAVLRLLPADADAAALQRFSDALAQLGEVTHPGIAGAQGAGEHDGRVYARTEHVEGRPLRELITYPPQPVPVVAGLIRQLADILDFAHTKGVAHRGVTPGSVVVDEHGAVHLLDFGVASAAYSSGLLGEDTPWPTAPAYAPPEWFGARGSGQAADAYAVGVVMFEMLTGEYAFPPSRPPSSETKSASLDPGDDFPVQLRQVVTGLTAPDPAERTSLGAIVPRLSTFAATPAPVTLPETIAGETHLQGRSGTFGPIPPQLGRYIVHRRLGAGGMGTVYLAHDPELRRQVAVKVLHAELGALLDQSHLRHEAQAMARLSHPNIVAVHDVGEVGEGDSSGVFIAMEYIQGTTLAERLSTGGARRWEETLALYLAAGAGLGAAHDAGLVHRDFKPANVLVGADGRVCVTDFGLAQTGHTGQRPDGQVSVDSTSRGVDGPIVGTPAYMSPEQIEGRTVTRRSDQFSFCVSLYEGLYGERPFPGETLEEVHRSMKRGEIRAPPPDARVPAWLRAAVLRGLELNPKGRWESMAALARELERDRVTPQRRRVALIGAAAAVVTLAMGGVWISTAGSGAAASASRVETTARPGVDQEPLLPLSLVVASAAPEDPREVALGRALFFDSGLSSDGSVSCASCHPFKHGGADPRERSAGVGGQLGSVNAPSIFNLRFLHCYNWPGKECDLERHGLLPLRNPAVMGNGPEELPARIVGDPRYGGEFAALYPEGATDETIARALAAYMRTLVTTGAPFDRFLTGDVKAITSLQRRGYALFKEVGCASCHQGVAVGGNLFQRFGVVGDYFADRGSETPADLGRFNVTGAEEDRYVFRVASLRNVELTAPYFHDGATDTLDDAVQVMAEYQLGRRLAPDEVDALVAFLESLTGDIPEVPS